MRAASTCRKTLFRPTICVKTRSSYVAQRTKSHLSAITCQRTVPNETSSQVLRRSQTSLHRQGTVSLFDLKCATNANFRRFDRYISLNFEHEFCRSCTSRDLFFDQLYDDILRGTRFRFDPADDTSGDMSKAVYLSGLLAQMEHGNISEIDHIGYRQYFPGLKQETIRQEHRRNVGMYAAVDC